MKIERIILIIALEEVMVLAMFLSGIGEVAESPFIVPVAGCVMTLGIVVASIWSGIRSREMQSQERLAAIAKGLPLPPSMDELAMLHGKPVVAPNRRRGTIRLWGIVMLGSAVGLILFFVALATILQQRDVLCGAALGLIPLGIGVGLLIDADLQKKELVALESGDRG
jgi:hypothetical protein